ncbi:MAG: GAF domain-containing protein [Desulfovibrio sp.]|nr:GAF domain-containing protein [Desulfovibrio sp.]
MSEKFPADEQKKIQKGKRLKEITRECTSASVRQDEILSTINEVSEKEKAFLGPHHILSILVAPVFVKDAFWGFVSCDDCRRERYFSREEECLLRSVRIKSAPP